MILKNADSGTHPHAEWQSIDEFLDSRYRAANPAEKVDLFLDEFRQHANDKSLKLDFDLSSFGNDKVEDR